MTNPIKCHGVLVHQGKKGDSKLQVAEYDRKPLRSRLGNYKPSKAYFKKRMQLIESEKITHRETIKFKKDFKRFYTHDVAIPRLLYKLIEYMKYEYPERSRKWWDSLPADCQHLRDKLILKR